MTDATENHDDYEIDRAVRRELEEQFGANRSVTEKQDAGKWELVRSVDTPLRSPSYGYITLDKACAILNALEADRTALQEMREALEAILKYEHGQVDCLDESGKAVCRAAMHRSFDIAREALKDRKGAELQG